MISEDLVNAFRNKYKHVHPLVFHRSVEKAKDANNLFDILEDIPEVPFFWDDFHKKWTRDFDFICINKAKDLIKKE